MSSEKSAIFREKVETMKEKTRQGIIEKRENGEMKLLEIEARVDAVASRRQEDQNQRMMRSEEQHLHMLDVRAQRDRIDRVEGYRRTELREQIDSNVERIE